MKEIVKQHPLRTIILEFDVDKPALDFEIAALDAYYRQHDRTWETKQRLLHHKDALFELEVKITELEYLLLPTEQQLDFLEARSEEHTSELQSLMRISYDVFCLKKKINNIISYTTQPK